MRIFISQPMKDKSKEEVLKERTNIQQKIIRSLTNLSQNEIVFIETFFDESQINICSNLNKDLIYLSKSLELMAGADLVVFPKDYALYRGCYIEYECAQKYGIQIGFYE